MAISSGGVQTEAYQIGKTVVNTVPGSTCGHQGLVMTFDFSAVDLKIQHGTITS